MWTRRGAGQGACIAGSLDAAWASLCRDRSVGAVRTWRRPADGSARRSVPRDRRIQDRRDFSCDHPIRTDPSAEPLTIRTPEFQEGPARNQRHRSDADEPRTGQGTAAAARAGVRHRDRLRRPRQLRDQPQRGLDLRLPAGVGGRRQQPDGDADPVPRRPRPASPPARACRRCAASTCPRPVTRGLWVQAEARGDRHRPGRGRRRRARPEDPLRPAPAGRRHDHRRWWPSRCCILQTRGHRPFEVGDHRAARGDPRRLPLRRRAQRPAAAGHRSRAPSRASTGTDSLLLAAGMLGATVMPHAIYLHSALTNGRYVRRTEDQRRALLRSQRTDVVIAMTIAGVMNLLLVVIAAAALRGTGAAQSTPSRARTPRFGERLGAGAALLFALALLASGFAASAVGTLAGQIVMEGFLQRRIPLVLRRWHHPRAGPGRARRRRRPHPRARRLPGGAVLRHPLRPGAAGHVHPPPDIMGALVNRRVTTAAASVVAGGDHRAERGCCWSSWSQRRPTCSA